MSVIVSNVAILTLFAIVGWILSKQEILSTQNLKLLSVLEVWVFLPCKTFQGFAKNCTVEYLSEKYVILFVSSGVLMALVLLNRYIVPSLVKNPYQQCIIRYSLTIPNYGYFGYALVEGVYGELALLDAMIFALPLSFYAYTEGYRMLTKQGKVSIRRIINPVFVSLVIGCGFGLTQWQLPGVLNSAIDKAAACMAPVSMLLAGIMISQYPIGEMMLNRAGYLVSAVRLLGIPMILGLVLSRFCPVEIVLVVVLMHAMPCGMNTIIFPNLIGEDCRLGASLAMVSTLLALVTIPMCVQFVEWLF